ncbi:SpoIIE family protein phosphatase [Streptomyces sp. 5-8]|uniref:SpoIIE family protein phosphatase n=1 Tax=Streptomyces musisoli TaxID=2802280 RepID=A0ABS1NWM4_9ACTN|nr:MULTISPECIES: SpoIIE family protein phosphatase [Streptomyces]MBL1104473.1 SpoIIE family protein phosphatase [Streptomyces musisoli]MBY8840446.1 SpoIIE family protein phosphatase [Streptomyces sp. SP2-10]
MSRPGDRPATRPPEQALDRTLAAAVRRTRAAAGGLYVLDERRRVLCLVATGGLPAEYAEPWTRIALAAPDPVADAVREDRLVWVGGLEELARCYPRAAAAQPYRFCMAAAPVSGPGTCRGALLLLWPAGRSPRAGHRERARMMHAAHRISGLLRAAGEPPVIPEQPRLVQVHGLDTRAPQAALGFAERLPGGSLALDTEGRITFVTSSAARLLNHDAASLLGRLPWQALPWLDDPAYADKYRTALLSREPVFFHALRPPGTWLDFYLFPGPDGISVRVVETALADRPPTLMPIKPPSAGRPIGVSRLYQLMHLAAALTEAAGVRDVVDLVAAQILPSFGAQGLVLSTAEAGRLKITGHRGYPPEVIESLDGLPLDTVITPAGQVLASGVPSFFADPAEMARSYPKTPKLSDKQAWAFLPLIVSGRPVGCCIVSYERPHTFTADERAVLTSLAGLIAQAMDRARLYDATHQLAHDLQQALLPRTLPRINGLDVAARYLPASHGMDIGGDFYDVIPLDQHTTAAVIGDVQGHSSAAAALMGQVRTAVHAHATAGATPDQVLARTNRVLTDVEPDLLVSCLYAHLDLSAHQITLASAGHAPPLMRSPDGRTAPLTLDPGPLLGIHAGALYPPTTVPLPVNTLLALYTDGLVEVPGRETDDTTAGLADHLARTDVSDLDQLIDNLVHHSWPQGWHTDDIALLLLRTTGAPGRA